MKRVIWLGALLAVLLGVGQAKADFQSANVSPGTPGDPPLTAGGGWTILDEYMVSGGYFAETFTFSGPVQFNVTDLYVVGDSFTVYDSGVAILTTPVVPDYNDPIYGGNPPYTTDPDYAFANPANWSSGSILLGAGGHSITIQDNTVPAGYPDGTVAVEIVAPNAAPEPATLTLLAIGITGLAGYSWRRRKQSVAA